MELINRHNDSSPGGHFVIKKTCKLLAQKYFWPFLRYDVKAYVKVCDVYLTSKAVEHKPYNDFQSLPILTHWWKDLLMDFVISLLISTN